MNERAGIFDSGPDFDISGFAPQKPKPAEPAEKVRKVAEAASFKSREAEEKRPKREPRRHRTGRNVHFGAKVTQQTYDALYDLADQRGWMIGEMLEHAVEALKAKLTAA